MENNRKMATTTTQTLNSCSNYTDDMPVYVSILERPKKPSGRPKTCTLTDEEKLERLRRNYKKYYYANPEREIARKKKENEFKTSKERN